MFNTIPTRFKSVARFFFCSGRFNVAGVVRVYKKRQHFIHPCPIIISGNWPQLSPTIILNFFFISHLFSKLNSLLRLLLILQLWMIQGFFVPHIYQYIYIHFSSCCHLNTMILKHLSALNHVFGLLHGICKDRSSTFPD